MASQRSAAISAAREAERQVEREAFNKIAPQRLLELLALANRIDAAGYASISVFFLNEVSAPISVRFRVPQGTKDDHYTEERVLTLGKSEEWEFASVESLLNEIDAARRESERMLKIAREAFDSLAVEQRKALGLTQRP